MSQDITSFNHHDIYNLDSSEFSHIQVKRRLFIMPNQAQSLNEGLVKEIKSELYSQEFLVSIVNDHKILLVNEF